MVYRGCNFISFNMATLQDLYTVARRLTVEMRGGLVGIYASLHNPSMFLCVCVCVCVCVCCLSCWRHAENQKHVHEGVDPSVVP